MLPPTPTQISFVTSFTISKRLKKYYFNKGCKRGKFIYDMVYGKEW